MSESKYDVAIAWRVYPGVTKTPPVFEDNKLKLVELCLRSLKASLGDLRVKFFALLDNCPSEYDDLLHAFFEEPDLDIRHYDGIGNEATFSEQIEILVNQTDAEFVYFARMIIITCLAPSR
jgi:hypothetical protein